MTEKSKMEKMVIDTIALVRSRKARPDLDRISKAMQRNHGVEPKETEKWLDILCDKGLVTRRPFKGAVSYRIVSPEEDGRQRRGVARSVRIAKRVTKAILELDPHGLGVSFSAIERFVATKWPAAYSTLNYRVRIRAALRDGIADGRFLKTIDNYYKLGQQPHSVEQQNEEPEEEVEDAVEDLLCDYCQQSADRNPSGEPEELLICKDCGNKAHPSCLNYSTELVAQIRAEDSWQCIDCKACAICDGTGDPDTLLFCDYCDKGYHMTCHSPKLDQMPSGKWICSSCTQRRGQNGSDVFVIDDEEEMATMVPLHANGKVENRGPPTKAQMQRQSQAAASTVANASSHMKSSRPDRVEPPSSHARVPHPPVPPYGQPMIALSTPSSHHGPPMGIPQQLPPGPHGMPPGQPMMNGPYGMPMGPGQHSSQHGPSPPVQSQHGPPGQRGLPGQHSIHGQSQGIKRPPPTSHGGPPAHHMRFAPDVRSMIREDVLRTLPPDVADWSVGDVSYYLKSHGYLGEAKLFEDQEIDGKSMLLMSRNDVLTGLRLKLGPALKIYHMHISKLQSRTDFIGV